MTLLLAIPILVLAPSYTVKLISLSPPQSLELLAFNNRGQVLLRQGSNSHFVYQRERIDAVIDVLPGDRIESIDSAGTLVGSSASTGEVLKWSGLLARRGDYKRVVVGRPQGLAAASGLGTSPEGYLIGITGPYAALMRNDLSYTRLEGPYEPLGSNVPAYNSSGLAVGSATYNYNEHYRLAMAWQGTSLVKVYNRIPGSQYVSGCTGVSQQGLICGGVKRGEFTDSNWDAWVWSSGQVVILPRQQGYASAGTADINDSGVVVGHEWNNSEPTTPLVWVSGQPYNFKLISDVGLYGFDRVVVQFVNDSGVIAGRGLLGTRSVPFLAFPN